MLVSLLEEDRERELYESYSAQCLWSLARAVYKIGNVEFDFPQYVEIIHPETVKHETAQQIKDQLLERLM